MLHHSRYADIDRQYLDQQVIRILGPNGQRSGIIIVGTQTLEQSLDIDADALREITRATWQRELLHLLLSVAARTCPWFPWFLPL